MEEVGLNSAAEPCESNDVTAPPNEEDNGVEIHDKDEDGSANNDTITYGEELQKPPQTSPSPAAAATPQSQRQVAIGVPLTRAFLAGIPPAKPYRRVTYTEWSPSPSSSSSSSESIAISLQSVKEVEKKVKTFKCMLISGLLSISCYTVCFLIVPFIVYMAYVIFYVVDQRQDSGEEAAAPLPGGGTSPQPIDEQLQQEIPCPYPLRVRDAC
jgi:hypothetical protein